MTAIAPYTFTATTTTTTKSRCPSFYPFTQHTPNLLKPLILSDVEELYSFHIVMLFRECLVLILPMAVSVVVTPFATKRVYFCRIIGKVLVVDAEAKVDIFFTF